MHIKIGMQRRCKGIVTKRYKKLTMRTNLDIEVKTQKEQQQQRKWNLQLMVGMFLNGYVFCLYDVL